MLAMMNRSTADGPEYGWPFVRGAATLRRFSMWRCPGAQQQDDSHERHSAQ